jgi:phosphodiesterase/alkaline phosphatase D-like protein
MRKKLALFAMFAALSSWSFARTLSTAPQDKDDQKNKQSTAQKDKDRDKDADDQNGDIDVVSGPSVDAASDHAVIRWRTDKVSASSIKYGTSRSNMSQEQKISGGSRDHDVTLMGLQPGTKYYFEIVSRNGQVRKTGEFTTQGNASASTSSTGAATASTSGGSDNVQIVSGLTPTNVTPTSATLVWKTDKVAASDVKYGTDLHNLTQRAYERGGDRDHSVDLTNLQPATTYYVAVLRRDGTVRTWGQFQTPASGTTAATPATPTTPTPAPGTPAPAATTVSLSKGPVVQYVNQNTAVISWDTNQQSSSTVKYGTDPNNLTQTATGNWGTNHQVRVQGLQPSTTYYFQAQSSPAEGTGNVASSGTMNFQTVAPGQQAKQQSWHF